MEWCAAAGIEFAYYQWASVSSFICYYLTQNVTCYTLYWSIGDKLLHFFVFLPSITLYQAQSAQFLATAYKFKYIVSQFFDIFEAFSHRDVLQV